MAEPSWCSRRQHPLIDLIVTREQCRRYANIARRPHGKASLNERNLRRKRPRFYRRPAINPANEQKIPIWIADYVLLGYGTGAIGGVPAHDERDLEFAKKFGLPTVEVVQHWATSRRLDSSAKESPSIRQSSTA